MTYLMDVVVCTCGHVADLADTMDQAPPIPYRAWPDRWTVCSDGRSMSFCPACDEEFDAAAIAESHGQERDYPWKRASA